MSLELLNATLKSGIKPSAMKFVMLSISNYANEDNYAYPSHSRISQDTGLNIKTVQKHMLTLESEGYIVDTGERKGRTKSTKVFSVNISKIVSTPKNGVPPLFHISTPKSGLSKHPQKRVIEPLYNNLKEPLHNSKEKHTDDQFEAFWKNYPCKKNKQQALKAWNRLSVSDRKLAHVRFNSFLEALPEFQKKDYSLHASTYLNNKRWEDEAECYSQYEGVI